MKSDNFDFWKRKPEELPKVFSHRGIGFGVFDNTITGYLRAIEAGSHGVEIDVSCTADGKLICFHDATMKRISGSGRRVRDVPFKTIRSVPLEGGERVPSLAEALEAIAPEIPIILDLKTVGICDKDMLKSLAMLLKDSFYEERRNIIISSFNYVALRYFHFIEADLPLGFLVKPNSIHHKIGMQRFFSSHYFSIHPHWRVVNAKSVKKWKDSGFAIYCWTINEPEEAVRNRQLGVDGIITDYPEKIINALK